MENILEAKNIFKAYSNEVLRDSSFSLKSGEILSIVGESGIGKSTLGRVCCGITPPDEGEIFYNGRSIFAFNKREMKDYKRQVQFIFQNPMNAINPNKSIEWILKEPMRVHGFSKSEMDKKINSSLEEFGLSKEILQSYGRNISGGQAQRVLIMSSVLLEPKVLICDEITASLDATIKIKIANLIKELSIKNKLSIVFITHDLNVANYISDRILLMEEGSLFESGWFSNDLREYGKKLLLAKNFGMNQE